MQLSWNSKVWHEAQVSNKAEFNGDDTIVILLPMAVMSYSESSESGTAFCYFLENNLGHIGADGGTFDSQGEASGHADEWKLDFVNN